ncbi:hypothetical protein Nepgr_027316 [Nepenthes gracilis]|uniref:Uncharacterized protein n=1 Tax=Nepenthes gracilis TaxID=150966 RepID=A0AAD3T8P7_NEPGR|nr:hypothetical protein Nepgr_027316 [Nepenthes gracilis]
MDEKPEEDKPPSRKKSFLKLIMKHLHKDPYVTTDSVTSPSPPPSPMKKSASTRSSCLCSPTTHVGSFRCRLHRNGSTIRRGHSVESDLSHLAANCDSK